MIDLRKLYESVDEKEKELGKPFGECSADEAGSVLKEFSRLRRESRDLVGALREALLA